MAGVATEIDTAMKRFYESGPFKNWADDNPGELKKIENYYSGATVPYPEGINTEFGLALVAVVSAGKYGDGTFPSNFF